MSDFTSYKKENNMILMGDTHSIPMVAQIILKKGLRDCTIFHVGDLGLGFKVETTGDIKLLEELEEVLEERNIQFYVIRGNHDYKLFWDPKMGLKLPKFHYLHLVEDYSVLEIDGLNILAVGGATSIDRTYRATDESYDYYEKFVLDEDKLNLILKKQEIDVVITHCPPSFCKPLEFNQLVEDWAEREKQHGLDLKAELDKERKAITKLYKMVENANNKLKYGIYGHMHRSYLMNKGETKYIGLAVNEVKQID